MATPIILSGLEVATNADILSGTRLQNAPAAGIMTFKMQAADGVVANNYTVSIQLPDGDTPLNAVQIPANGTTAGIAGVLNEEDAMIASFPVDQGGHTVFSCTETGDTELFWILIFTPL